MQKKLKEGKLETIWTKLLQNYPPAEPETASQHRGRLQRTFFNGLFVASPILRHGNKANLEIMQEL